MAVSKPTIKEDSKPRVHDFYKVYREGSVKRPKSENSNLKILDSEVTTKTLPSPNGKILGLLENKNLTYRNATVKKYM